jgi:hypothetical protein
MLFGMDLFIFNCLVLLLRDIHVKLLTQYDYKEVCVPTQSQINVGTGVRLHSQDDISQQ